MRRKLEDRLARLEQQPRYAMGRIVIEDRELARRIESLLGGGSTDPDEMALKLRVMELLK